MELPSLRIGGGSVPEVVDDGVSGFVDNEEEAIAAIKTAATNGWATWTDE